MNGVGQAADAILGPHVAQGGRVPKPASSQAGVEAALRTARELASAGDIARAEQALNAVLARDPEQPDALYALARLALEHGRDAEAVPLLERVLRHHAGVARVHADL